MDKQFNEWKLIEILYHEDVKILKNKGLQEYYSFANTLLKEFLNPELSCYESAQCHALSSGEKGYVGHDRVNKDCKMDFYGECCQYGYSKGLDIVLDLLFDYDVPSVGHRKICMSKDYQFIGASTKPHTVYQFNTVIDFK